MLALSCTFIGICLFVLGSSGNTLCILVFLRKKFRHRIITPYFIVLLLADSIYLLFRLIKLLYYSQTLFRLHSQTEQLCSNTYFVRIYQYASQTWPQPFVPLVHSETYIRFSLILMCIMSIQRTKFISRSIKFLILPTSSKDSHQHRQSCLLILIAFLIAYSFEFAGLTVFCSKSNNREMTYDWFLYMTRNMQNASVILTNTMTDQTQALTCVNYAIKTFQEQPQISILQENPVCTQEQLVDYLAQYFDEHQRPIVNLIQKIIFYQSGHRISRNEIRRKFHFHECLFPQDPNLFLRSYDFMYSRLFGLNRHTLLLVFGSILPSLITIGSNLISVFRVQELNRVTSAYILPCRRRTDDTRRILLVITIECLFAIVNSWFSDILLALIYCKRNISAGDDCPQYLKQNYDLLVLFDLFNSVSNIILHCLCGRRFRNELRRMIKGFFKSLKHGIDNLWCCYCRIECPNAAHPEHCVTYHATLTQQDSSNSSNNINQQRVHLKIKPASKTPRRHCCDCQWFISPRPITHSNDCRSNLSQELLQNNRTTQAGPFHSLTVPSYVPRPTQPNSMKLYYPPQQTLSSTVLKNQCTHRR